MWELFDSTDLRDHAEARAICNTCPTLRQCAAELQVIRSGWIYSSPSGTWAGQLFGTSRKPREHGTERGYQQHRRQPDEEACPACLNAHRLAQRKPARRSA